MKKLHLFRRISMLIFSVFLILGCREEQILPQKEEQSNSTNISSSKIKGDYITFSEIKKSLKNKKILNDFSEVLKKSKSNILSRNSNYDYLFFEKNINAQTGVVTYNLPLINYSKETPYFLHYIITIEKEKEKNGFIKYIPDQVPVDKYRVLENFTGDVQILSPDFTLLATSHLAKGVVNKTGSTTSKTCYDVIDVIIHYCTNGGHHIPGEKCTDANGNEIPNDAYYEFAIRTQCGPNNFDESIYINNNPAISGGGTSVIALNQLTSHVNFQYTGYLSNPNKQLLIMLLMDWAEEKLANTDLETAVTEINQKLDFFAQNDSIFDQIDVYNQNSLNGSQSNSELLEYSTRIHSLLSNLFNNPTQENADFTKWGINFLDQNRLVDWKEFKDTFMSNQHIIDGLTGYRCAQDLLKQMPTLNNELAKLLNKLFVNSDKYNITFKSKTGLGEVDGTTSSMSIKEAGIFKSTIFINDEVLKNATKEYILITMYHEVIHAYLDSERFRLGISEFNNQYPNIIVGFDYLPDGTQVNRYFFDDNHVQFGPYLDELKNILSSYNSNLSAQTISALAKTGITQTTAQEHELNQNERDTSLNKYTGTKCP